MKHPMKKVVCPGHGRLGARVFASTLGSFPVKPAQERFQRCPSGMTRGVHGEVRLDAKALVQTEDRSELAF